jgi:hypothetical protein
MKGLAATMQKQQSEATRLERIKADVEAARAG